LFDRILILYNARALLSCNSGSHCSSHGAKLLIIVSPGNKAREGGQGYCENRINIAARWRCKSEQIEFTF